MRPEVSLVISPMGRALRERWVSGQDLETAGRKGGIWKGRLGIVRLTV